MEDRLLARGRLAHGNASPALARAGLGGESISRRRRLLASAYPSYQYYDSSICPSEATLPLALPPCRPLSPWPSRLPWLAPRE